MENAFFLNRVSLCRMTGYTEHTDWLLLFGSLIFNQSMPTKSYFFSYMCVSHLPSLKIRLKNTNKGTEHICDWTKH